MTFRLQTSPRLPASAQATATPSRLSARGQMRHKLTTHTGRIYRRAYRLAATAGIALFCSCLGPHNIRMVETDPDCWSSAVTVAYDNSDTLSLRTLYILTRFNRSFSYDRLGLAVTTTTPEGYKWRDTVALRAFDAEPRSGLFFDREQLLRIRTRLALPGRYLFTFTPVMPEGAVEGINAVGIDIR